MTKVWFYSLIEIQKKATGYYYMNKAHDEFNEKDQQKNIMLNLKIIK